jgi:hypothetical protein
MCLKDCEALLGFFPLYFQLPYLPEETCFVFSKRDLLRWNVPASLSLFLKSEKKSQLCFM